MTETTRIEPVRELPRAPLAWWTRAFRVLGFLGIGFFFLVLMSGGTPESRFLYLLAGFLGFVNPVWNLYALALLGGLYLNSSGAYYMNVLIDALAVGAVAGELRLLGRGDREALMDHHVMRGVDPASPGAMERLKVNWGAWPAVVLGIVFLIWASAVPSAVFSVFETDNRMGASWLRHTTHKMLWGWEEDFQFGLRAACNWTVGVGLACVAARRATAFRVARFFKLGGIGLLFCCALGLLELACQKMGVTWFSLAELRDANNFPWQQGRFQATAGHAGWFGEWLLLTWPGVVLMGLWAGRIRRAGAALGVLLVFFCLLMTGARAAWVGMIAEMAGLALFLLLTRLVPVRKLVIGLVVTAVVALILGFVAYHAGGDVLAERMLRTRNLSGRENYFSSSLIFLRELPLGIGLGQHFILYHTWFNEVSYHFFQSDHVTAHCFPLHILVECGPFLALLVVGAFIGFLTELLRAWSGLPTDHKVLAVVPALAIVGIMANGVADYFFYIRVIEYAFWICAGLGIGLWRRYSPRGESTRTAFATRGLLLASGIGAAIVMVAQFSRPLIDEYPRVWDVYCDKGVCFYTKWTPKSARFPVEPDAVRVEFTIFRKGLPGTVTVTWPDGAAQNIKVKDGTWMRLKHDLVPTSEPGRFVERRWVHIDADVAYTPVRWETDNPERRPLGLYVNEFFVWFPWDVEKAKAEGKWTD